MREGNRFSMKIRERKVLPFGEGVFQTQQPDMNLRAGFSCRAVPDFPGSKSKRACRADISLHEPIFFHGRMDNVALDFHPAFQGDQSHSLFCLHDRFDSRERFAAQRDDQRLFGLLNLLK